MKRAVQPLTTFQPYTPGDGEALWHPGLITFGKFPQPDPYSLPEMPVFLLIGAGAIISAETGLWLDGRWVAPTLLALIGVGVVAGIRRRDENPVAVGLTPAEQDALGELPEPPQ